MSASESTQRGQNVLRFALYGLKNSGKTCILAALAMKRLKHPKGLTCTRMRTLDGLERPDGNPDQWDVSKRNDAFFIGQEYMDKAIERLENGDVPAPTPNFSSPLVYLFEFSAPGQWSFVVELYDYSGELVDPNLTHSALAQNLRGHLREMDGLLILAEAPFPEKDMEPLTRNLHKLEEAFTTLKKEKEDKLEWAKPIALLLNKWDRRSPIEYHNPEEEDAELNAFLDARDDDSHFLPYGGLVDKLKNSVVEGDFRAFAVSAFGDHRMSANTELPARINPLPAFGLEDPFIWAARRCAEKRVQLLEEISRPFDFNPRRAQRAKRESTWLCRHLPNGSAERGRAQLALRRAWVSLIVQTAVFIAVLVLSTLIAEYTYDGVKYRSITATYNNASATQDALDNADQWMDGYYRAPSYRHILSHRFVLSRDSAASRLQEIQSARESNTWSSVEQAEDFALKIKLASTYLEKYGENGKYRDSAKVMVAQWEQKTERDENAKLLKSIETDLEALKRGGTIQDENLEKLKNSVSNLPHPSSITPELLEQRDQLLSKISDEAIKIATQKGLEVLAKLKNEYERLLLAGDIVAAHEKLAQWSGDEAEIKKIRASFPERSLEALKKSVREKTGAKLWKQSKDLLAKVKGNTTLVELYGKEFMDPVNDLEVEIDCLHDKALYDDVRRQKTIDALNTYIDTAPRKSMEPIVKEYRNYIDRINGQIECELSLEFVEWSKNVKNGYDADVTVSVDSKVVIEGTTKTKPSMRSGKIGEGPLRGNLKDTKNISVKIVRRDGYLTWGSATYESGSLSKEFKSLNGPPIPLIGDDGNTNYAHFKLLGLPIEPALPDWKDK